MENSNIGNKRYAPGKCQVFAKPYIEEYVLLFGVEKGKEFFELALYNYHKERNEWYKLAIDNQDCFNRIRISDSVDITQSDLTGESK